MKIISNNLLLLVVITLTSCQNSRNSNSSKQQLEIVSASKTHIVGGAPGRKGVRIVLELKKSKGLEIDSVEFGGRRCQLDFLESKSQAFYFESYFYTKSGGGIMSDSPFNVDSVSCTVIYRENGIRKERFISKLEDKVDSTLWK